ncbi:TM2 domain-containing protein [Cohnella nanjingensis]|uniref:NINE protein n=1 Tax=Cohnella nanjingensis TaxID=1387779 RepID=A0A7X0RPQ3_9BACL|nr:TM2 domain-containing protein [Cohnella nanjingensis]MBB6671300.1 NINE protein [Cohnella nanjingensis]
MKNKIAAGVFGIVLGGLGVHKFYLGRIKMGVLYLLFCWTGIPSIVGIIEGVLYLTMSDPEFNERYAG